MPVAPAAPKDDQLFGPRIGTHGAGDAFTTETKAAERTRGEETESRPQPSESGAATSSDETLSFDGMGSSETEVEENSDARAALASAELLDAAFEEMADEGAATGA